MRNRTILVGLTFLALHNSCSPTPQEVSPLAEPSGRDGYVLGIDEGEILENSRGRTTIIKVSPETGARDLAWMSSDMPPGSNILVHRHDRAEEILFVHKGSGTVILGDERLEVEEGSTIFVPPGTWHGMDNPDDHVHIVFVVSPSGLENFFRGMYWHPGEEPKQLTPEQISEIAQKHDSVARNN